MYDGMWQGSAVHPQVDTRLGFTVDEELLKFVMPIRDAGFNTDAGWCQNTNESGGDAWLIPRRRIGYVHADAHALLDFCLHIRKCLMKQDGWNQTITVDNYFVPPTPSAVLTFVARLDDQVLEAINSYCRETPRQGGSNDLLPVGA